MYFPCRKYKLYMETIFSYLWYNLLMRPLNSLSHLRFPINDYLGSDASVRVLRVLFAHGGALSTSQLAQDSGLTPQGTRHTLDKLASNKIVKVLGQSGSRLFSVDVQNPMAKALKALFNRERARWDEVISDIRVTLQTNGNIEAAWYYGSVARGEDTAASDFDIVVIAPEGKVDAVVESVRQSLRKIEDQLYVNCSVVGLSGSDVARLSAGDKWWHNLVRDAKVLQGVHPEEYLSNSNRSRAAS